MKFVLGNPDKQFAPWPERHSTEFNRLENTRVVRSQNPLLGKNGTNVLCPVKIRGQKNLSRAGRRSVLGDRCTGHIPHFVAALENVLREIDTSTEQGMGRRVASCRLIHTTLEDWDREALLNVLNVLHTRNQNVPRQISLEMLDKIAIIVSYFECCEAVEPSQKFGQRGYANLGVKHIVAI